MNPTSAFLGRLLEGWPRRRVTLDELWGLLDQADPASQLSVRRRSLLASALGDLAEAGAVALPSQRSFDRSQHPPLPKFVTMPAAAGAGDAAPASRSQSRIVWHPALSWVPQAALTPAQQDVMVRVDRWLHRCEDPGVVPVRERSLEIFDDEKALDRIERTSLFAPGRLSLALLRCRRVVPRFVWERVGSGGLLLVVENCDTFDSLVEALREPPGGGPGRRRLAEHRVGSVGWGAGAAFEASVRSIATLPVTRVRYFGDLDEAGLRIPAAAAATARADGLPEVLPAAGLYSALLRLGHPQAGQRKVTAGTAATLCGWLDERHRVTAGELLRSGQRLAQEAVGAGYLHRYLDWLEDLR